MWPLKSVTESEFLPPAYEVRREGNVFSLSVHRGYLLVIPLILSLVLCGGTPGPVSGSDSDPVSGPVGGRDCPLVMRGKKWEPCKHASPKSTQNEHCSQNDSILQIVWLVPQISSKQHTIYLLNNCCAKNHSSLICEGLTKHWQQLSDDKSAHQFWLKINELRNLL